MESFFSIKSALKIPLPMKPKNASLSTKKQTGRLISLVLEEPMECRLQFLIKTAETSM